MYSNFCDENHTYYLAHYGVPGMKWRRHIFGGRDKAFSKSGVRRAQTYTNGKKLGGAFGVYSRTAFDKEKNAVGEYINRGNNFNLNPGPYQVGLGLNQSRGSRGNDRTKNALRARTAGSSKGGARALNDMKAKPQSGQRRHRPPEDPIEARNLLDSTKQLARATGASQGNEREYRRFLEAQYGRSGKGGNKRKRGARR